MARSDDLTPDAPPIAEASRRAARSALTPRVWIQVAAGAVLAATIALGANALTALGRPFPGFVVDAYGRYSNVAFPGWAPLPVRLHHSDRVVKVGDAPILSTGRYGALPVRAFFEASSRAAGRGAATEVVVVRSSGQRLTLARALVALSVREFWFYFVLYNLMAIFAFSSGVVMYLLAGRREGALAYVFWSLCTYAFLATFFDYHTDGVAAPVFSLATLWTPVANLGLAWAFPTPPDASTPAGGAARKALLGVALLAAVGSLWTVFAGVTGRDASAVRAVVNVAAPLSMVGLVAAMGARWWYARRHPDAANLRQRSELRSAFLALIAASALGFVGFAPMLLVDSAAFHFALPLLSLTVPSTVGYALVRHNALETTAVLSRRVTLVFIAILAVAFGSAVWLLSYSASLRYGGDHVSQLVVALLCTGAAAYFAWLAVNRYLFRAGAAFRPTMEQLADQLSRLRTAEDVRATLERGVLGWLPSDTVRVVDAQEVEALPTLAPSSRAQLATARHLYTDESPLERALIVPLRSFGEVRGALVVHSKRGKELFTDEDIALLETIAAVGAVALDSVQNLQRLDALRQMQLAASDEDKRFTLMALGAVHHEAQTPINYIELQLNRASDGVLDPEQADAALGELQRIRSLLRSLVRPDEEPAREGLHLAEITEHTLEILGDLATQRGVRMVSEVPASLVVYAARDELVQLLANLLRNSAQAAGSGGTVGIRAHVSDEDRGAVIDVWDTGPGVPEEIRDRIWQPWVTGRAAEGGMGLGLTVCARIVRRLGWTIDYEPQGGQTCFRIRTAPPSGAGEREGV